MKTFNNLIKQFGQSTENKWIRFFILIVAGGLGVVLVKYFGEWVTCFLGITGRAGDYLVFPMMSIFVFLALWYFRTYDTRQQIQQTNFTKGIEELLSSNPLRVDVGVMLLLEVSKATAAFDKEIRLAFIKRLKELPGELDGISVMVMRANRLSYAQHILQWLIDEQERGGEPLDLRGMDCRYQEFKSGRFSGGTNSKLELAKISPRLSENELSLHPGITFEEADCENISFKGVILAGYDFTNAVKVDITGGYMRKVNTPNGHFMWPPRGLDEHQISPEDLDTKTGEVLRNPNWANPGTLTHEVVRVHRESKIY